ncbi:MAG TPA: hypothetical protein O0X60_00785 [Methanocorpusculum sp.]|nr:hypothetical protein [Methanocorpusculum sp.]
MSGDDTREMMFNPEHYDLLIKCAKKRNMKVNSQDRSGFFLPDTSSSPY